MSEIATNDQSGGSDETEAKPQLPAKGPFSVILRMIKRRSGSTEKATRYDGAFSYADEWHAAAIAFAVGFAGTPDHQQKIVTYALGLGGGKSALSDDPHIRDLADEPAYALGALAAGRMAKNGELTLQALPL